MKIICYGDSNTFGYDPYLFNGRYSEADRWVDILGKRLHGDMINCGLNGRMIPFTESAMLEAAETIQSYFPADILIIWLGTNDAWSMSEPDFEAIAERMDRFVACLRHRFTNLKIVLGVPPMIPGRIYTPIADKHRLLLADGEAWNLPVAFDKRHYTPEAHHILAEKMEELLNDAI